MTLKMILVLALCGFVANLPTAFSISCYACGDYPGSSQPCSNPSVINCEHYYDSCMTTNVSAEMMGIQYSTTVKNCSISACQCNSSFVCDQVNSSISQANGTLHSCSVSCCYGDLCNGQGGGGGNVTLPPWTNPPTTYYPPFTTQNPHQGCGNVVYNKLESPGYPNNYPNSLNCVNYVNIPYGMTLNIYFADFFVEYGWITCSFDYLKITNDRGQSFGKYCGNETGQRVIVTGRRAVISFHSDGGVQRRGYQLLFSFNSNPTLAPSTNPPTTHNPPTTYYPPFTTQNPSQANATLAPSTNPPTTHNPPTTYYPPYTTQNPSQGCGSVVYNMLQSPGYPNNYPNSLNCVNYVNIPYGKTLNIYFADFDVEHSYSCSYDYLEITNDRGQSFGKYCGQRTGQNVNVTGRRAVISFHSDGSVRKRGYKLRFYFNSNATLAPSTNPPTTHNPPTTNYPPYTTQNPSQGCGSVINNTLKSPGYPSNYPANMDCVYWVHIPHGMAMRVYFNHFYLEDDYSCRWDYLKISNENNQTFGKYCGQKNRHSVYVSGHYAVISFHSDGSYQRSGYHLTFYFYSNSTSAPFTTNGPYPTGYPTGVPINTGRPTPGTPGPNPQSRLKYYINVCKALLVQMEYIVDNQLGNNNVSVREHKARVKKAIDDVDAALKSDGRQKRDVMKTMMVDQLKKKADELLNKMEAKQGQFKKRTLLKLREKKREAKGRQLIRKTAKTIRDTLDNMVPKKQ